jgi:hypothetical protein
MNRAALHEISYAFICHLRQRRKFNGQIANSLIQATSKPLRWRVHHQGKLYA